MFKHFEGQDVNFSINGTAIRADNISLDINDESAVAYTYGRPDGYTLGQVGAEGEVELSSLYFNLLLEAVNNGASFQEIPPVNFLFFAESADKQMKIEVFGCKLAISSLLSIDPNSNEKNKHKIKYIVTSPDFITINGKSYLRKRP